MIADARRDACPDEGAELALHGGECEPHVIDRRRGGSEGGVAASGAADAMQVRCAATSALSKESTASSRVGNGGSPPCAARGRIWITPFNSYFGFLCRNDRLVMWLAPFAV